LQRNKFFILFLIANLLKRFIYAETSHIHMEIKKKTWPELFQRMFDGKKNTDLRLADFEIKEGDTLVLEEYNPETKEYTGRVLKKKVKSLNKVNLTDFHTPEQIAKYGHWIIELE